MKEIVMLEDEGETRTQVTDRSEVEFEVIIQATSFDERPMAALQNGNNNNNGEEDPFIAGSPYIIHTGDDGSATVKYHYNFYFGKYMHGNYEVIENEEDMPEEFSLLGYMVEYFFEGDDEPFYTQTFEEGNGKFNIWQSDGMPMTIRVTVINELTPAEEDDPDENDEPWSKMILRMITVKSQKMKMMNLQLSRKQLKEELPQAVADPDHYRQLRQKHQKYKK